LVYVTGGELTMSDVYMIHYTTTVPAVSVTGGGDLRLYGGRIFPGGVAWTVPLVQQASGGALQMNNMDLTGQAGSTGVAVSFATDVAGNSLGNDVKVPSGWTVAIPASPYNGYYATLVDMVVGMPTATAEVNLVLQSAPNIQREVSFLTSANLRWRVVVDASSETGADAGANFSIARFHDNGNIIDAPISINRASGIVQLTNTTIQGRVGFNNEAPFAKPTVTGAKGGNTALASLLTALAGYGLIVDGST
jgi:hypothetical protein